MWKDIRNWEGLYEVSDHGTVRNIITGHELVGDINSAGYHRVCLYRKGHNPPKERFLTHRLVAEHFILNKGSLPEVNHIDGNKSNNSAVNLEWVDRCGNELHSRRTGIKPYRPFIVTYTNGDRRLYETTGELTQLIPVTRRTVTNWLKRLYHGYEKHQISDITYV